MIKVSSKHLIHTVLGHSYIVFVVFFCIAIFADMVFPITIPNSFGSHLEYVGVVFVLLGTLLVTWAQTNSKKSLYERHQEKHSVRAFLHGPYKFLRTPTQIGLFFLLLGLGLVIEIFWVPIFTVIALVINLSFFVKKQERILAKNYGRTYTLYKRRVRF